MPLFDYTCNSCKKDYKDMLVRTPDEDVKCPDCGISLTKHFPSKTSFALKGGGWANDNYTTPKPIPPVGSSD